jgi:hypothetical protein
MPCFDRPTPFIATDPQDEEDRKANRHLLHALSNVTTNEEGHAEVRVSIFVGEGGVVVVAVAAAAVLVVI